MADVTEVKCVVCNSSFFEIYLIAMSHRMHCGEDWCAKHVAWADRFIPWVSDDVLAEHSYVANPTEVQKKLALLELKHRVLAKNPDLV